MLSDSSDRFSDPTGAQSAGASPAASGDLLPARSDSAVSDSPSYSDGGAPGSDRAVLVARDLEKRFASGGRELVALSDVSFRVEPGELVAVVGPSGSGKTTLLGLLAGLDLPSGGSVRLDGTDLASLSEDGRARLRREKVGFVFQSFQLLPSLTAQENVQVPLELLGEAGAAGRAREWLERVGLGARATHHPAQLSGGEQQRVALARAFVHGPRILFADEPTGNLDAATGAAIVDLLVELNREHATTLVLVTHEDLVARRARRILRLADGCLVEDVSAG